MHKYLKIYKVRYADSAILTRQTEKDTLKLILKSLNFTLYIIYYFPIFCLYKKIPNLTCY